MAEVREGQRGPEGGKRRKGRKATARARGEGGASRPAFAASYPDHPDVERLLAAFEAGNFAYVRREAPQVAQQTEDEAVARAARDLRRRIDPSPTSLYLWALGVALLAFLYTHYLGHG